MMESRPLLSTVNTDGSAHLEPGIPLQFLEQQNCENSNEIGDAVQNPVPTKEMTILAYLVFSESNSCPEVLAHPVAQTFLDLKWAQMKEGHLLFLTSGLKFAVYIFYIFLAMQIYFNDCPLHHHAGRSNTSIQCNDTTAMNSSTQTEDGLMAEEVECEWSLWTLVPLPFVFLFLSLSLVHEIIKAYLVWKCEKQFFRSRKTYLRISLRMFCFLLVIVTTIPPWSQRSLYTFQYPLAAVRV
jgi:hypothetical protein